jgi:hypothetical protein
MARQLNLENAANWRTVYSQNFTAGILPLTTGNKIIPIPEIAVPIELESTIIKCRITTNIPEGRSWRYAGILLRKVRSGDIVGAPPDAVISRRSLYLDDANLLIFQKLSGSYSAHIILPTWFADAQVVVSEYIGIDIDDLDVIRQDVQAIKQVLM